LEKQIPPRKFSAVDLILLHFCDVTDGTVEAVLERMKSQLMVQTNIVIMILVVPEKSV